MLIDLDDEGAEDPSRVGAKAAWLARGRRAGLPVLPGVVVPTGLGRAAMLRGVEAMAVRGSGGARLAISQEPLPEDLSSSVIDAAQALGDPLVVRSSSILESSGEWSGAFTSYLDIHPDELPVAVRGCWASAFTVHTLQRYAAAGIAPGSAPMAVLIQRALDPEFGGVARMSGDAVTVVGVAGSPAPLVQGWEPGVHAIVPPSGIVRGDAALQLLGSPLIEEVVSVLRRAHQAVGATSCEWAVVDGAVAVLQLMRGEDREMPSLTVPEDFRHPAIAQLARLIRRFPGPLGEELVLPWAAAAPERFLEQRDAAKVDPLEALGEALEQARTLISEVWGGPKSTAVEHAVEQVRQLRAGDPGGPLEALGRLRPPDPERADWVLRLLARVRLGLAEAGAISSPDLGWHVSLKEAQTILRTGGTGAMRTRIGFDRWEPFDVAAVISRDRMTEGTPAAPGIAVGRMCYISDPGRTDHFRPRDVVVCVHPLPNLAALLWDASALVTTGGGPGAHLFESARALAIPAVASVHLEGLLGGQLGDFDGAISLAVDGTEGRVWADDW